MPVRSAVPRTRGRCVMPVAIITGASKGLGRALAAALAGRGWDLVLDARTPGPCAEAAARVAGHGTRVAAVPGDVTDAAHRGALVAAARELGGRRPAGEQRERAGRRAAGAAGGAAAGRGCGGRWRRMWWRRSAWCGRRCRCCGRPRRARCSTSARTRPWRRTRPGAATGRPRPRWTSSRGGAGRGGAGAAGVGGGPGRHGDRTCTRRPCRTTTTRGRTPATVVPAFLRLLDERPPSGRYGAAALLEAR